MRWPARGLAGLLLAVAACAPTPSTGDVGTTPPSGLGSPSPGVAATPTPGPTPSASPASTPPPTPASAIVPGSVDRSSLELTATYAVTATIGVATGGLDVTTVIRVRNDAGEAIDRLDLNTIAARLGEIEITAASVDDVPVEVSVADQTLRLPFGGLLPDGASTTVRIAYRAMLRRGLGGSDWMFTRASGTLSLYRWIPWVSRAVPFDRPNHGDPFVSPSSPEVHVEILTDRPMVLAAPAAEVEEEAAGAGRAWSFTMRDVRDVSIVLAPDFQLTEADADGIAIRAWTRPGGLSGDRLIAQAAHALTTEGGRLGVPYPLPAFTVVETEGGYGLESPGLIWIPDDVDSTNLAYLVHHETAHQWFYGLVGNDQQAEPFADEAAADLLARTALGTLRRSRCAEDDLDRAIPDYSQACYYEVVYVQGGLLLDQLRKAMGTDRFWNAMGAYLVTHRDGLGGTKVLLDALRAASPVDILPTLRARFPGIY